SSGFFGSLTLDFFFFFWIFRILNPRFLLLRHYHQRNPRSLFLHGSLLSSIFSS
ncbi:unnamed protein product, partial [Arabidopsis halleri]